MAYSHKVSDAALSSIGIQGNTLAVGDANGTVFLLEVSDSLAHPQQSEKSAVNAMLERETKREKNLEVRERDIKRAKAQAEAMKNANEGGGDDREDEMTKLESEFFRMVA